MKNNKLTKAVQTELKTIETALNKKPKFGLLLPVLAVLVLGLGLLNGLSNENQLSDESKEVVSSAVPQPPLSELSKESGSSKKKLIRSLSLNPSRTLKIYGEVNFLTEELAGQITKLSKSSKEPIVILIDSPGGSVLSGEKILSAIEASRADVYTVCVGMCASMAAIIHQYGTKRLATDRSVLMFHDASGMVGGRVSEMLNLLSLIKRKIEKINHHIADRAKMPYSEFVALEANNFWIDSEDGMEKNLVDDLVVIQE